PRQSRKRSLEQAFDEIVEATRKLVALERDARPAAAPALLAAAVRALDAEPLAELERAALEPLIEVALELDFKTVLTLSELSRTMRLLFTSRELWQRLLERDFPGPPLRHAAARAAALLVPREERPDEALALVPLARGHPKLTYEYLLRNRLALLRAAPETGAPPRE